MLPTDHSMTVFDQDAFVREAFVTAARSYVGCPWLHMGRTRRGIDCVGIIINAGLECGLHQYDDEIYYTRKSSGQDLLAPFRAHMIEMPLNRHVFTRFKPADLLIFKDKYYPQHVGILATRRGKPSLIHASIVHRKVHEEYITADWEHKAITAFRFKFFSESA